MAVTMQLQLLLPRCFPAPSCFSGKPALNPLPLCMAGCLAMWVPYTCPERAACLATDQAPVPKEHERLNERRSITTVPIFSAR